MNIYLDESGIFANPQGKAHAESVMGALVIPSEFHEPVVDGFRRLTASWECGGEIKGKDLGEEQVAAVINYLAQHFVLLEFYAADLGVTSNEDVQSFKRVQADKLVENVTSNHHPDLVAELTDIRQRVLTLSDQLFVQLILGTHLVANVIQRATLYYCQRLPSELGQFRWCVDAKNDRGAYEDLWAILLPGFLQAVSMTRPLIQLAGGDYRAFDRFCGRREQAPIHLAPHRRAVGGPFLYVDVKRVVRESFVVGDSRDYIAGLLTHAQSFLRHGRLEMQA